MAQAYSLPGTSSAAGESNLRPPSCTLRHVPAPYILAIDQGTTSSRALIVDAAGAVAGVGQQPFNQIYPQPGWVEHEPEEIWSTTLESIGIALAQAIIRSGSRGQQKQSSKRQRDDRRAGPRGRFLGAFGFAAAGSPAEAHLQGQQEQRRSEEPGIARLEQRR